MITFLKKSWLWFLAALSGLLLIFLYRKASALRNELKLLQAVELKRRTQLEEAQALARVEDDQKRITQLKVELSYLRSSIRERDEKLVLIEQDVKEQTDQVLKAKSFAELERLLNSSREEAQKK
jgi:uncharacterized protein HemX